MNHRPEHPITTASMAGFTLIEVLVAVLVLAIGMLGIAALIVQGMRYNHDSYLRSQVSTLAYDIIDRMRINRANAANYVSNYTAQTPAGGNACDYTLAASAANDLGCWNNEVDFALPPGSTSSITTTGSQYTVTLSWTDRENQQHNVNYTFQP
ncbi:MAG TPA: type IV pilus modification protein PilV [Gammaproteobacteria bacterium]|nr:type IV pilus modification protein PilV [Gammaproteobacteria bacterium]